MNITCWLISERKVNVKVEEHAITGKLKHKSVRVFQRGKNNSLKAFSRLRTILNELKEQDYLLESKAVIPLLLVFIAKIETVTRLSPLKQKRTVIKCGLQETGDKSIDDKTQG